MAKALAHAVDQVQQSDLALGAVGCGVDTDDRIPAAIQQSIHDGGGNAGLSHRWDDWVAGARPTGPPNPMVLRNAVTTSHRRATADQVLVAHQFAHRGDHFRGEAGSQRSQHRRSCGIPPATSREFAHRHGRHGCEGQGVVGIQDQPRHLVRFIRNQGLIQQLTQRQVPPARSGPRAAVPY